MPPQTLRYGCRLRGLHAPAPAISDAARTDRIARGRERANQFTWDRFKQQTIKVFQHLVGEARLPR